jgi:rRNA-processing protein FCF1
MEVLLDSNFIISSIRRKIDFLSELEILGFKIILPREVYQELKDLKLKVSSEDKVAIEIALKMIDSSKIKKMTLGNVSVDEGLIQKGRQGYYIASLDAGIKRQIPNKIFISNATNSITVERN